MNADATIIILVILVVIYVPIWLWTFKSPKAKEKGLEIYGPAIKINTHFGIKTMERFSKYKRFWRVYGAFSQVTAFFLMAAMVFLMAMAVYRLPQTLQQGGMGIQYALALPGINPIMPFWFTVLALIVALVLHEMGHGLQARANGIPVIHTGLLYGVVPLGAFVEPDDTVAKKALRRARLHLYSAGIATNFVLGAVSFLIFTSALIGGIHSPYDSGDTHLAGVYSSVDSDGVPAGSILLDVQYDETVYSYTYSDLLTPRDAQDFWPLGTPITVHYDTEHAKNQAKSTVWGAYIAVVSKDGPAEKAGLQKGDVIFQITDNTQGASAKYFYSAEAFSKYMGTTRSGDSVTIDYYSKSSGSASSVTLDLGSKGSIGFLGVSVATAGMSLATPSQIIDIATNPFYGRETIPDKAVGMVSYLANPFSGFSPVPDALHWWFNQPFAGFWIVMSIFYWMFWLNILLGVTNALPAMPFDGGLIFRDWTEGILERFGKKNKTPAQREAQVNEVAKNVSMLMLVLFVVVIISSVL